MDSKITTAGVMSTLARTDTLGFADGTATAAQLGGPVDVAIDIAGNVYAGDDFNQHIQKITMP